MKRILAILLSVLALAGGACPPAVVQPSPPEGLRVEPLPIQQARAYGETVTGLFVSLADFEDVAGAPRGSQQVHSFRAQGGAGALCEFVVNRTRTGAGALHAVVPPRGALVYDIAEIHDFSGYTLLSFAIFSYAIRDDLAVTLVSEDGSWTSPPQLLVEGWNNVLIDIRRLGQVKPFNLSNVRSMRIEFHNAGGDIEFNLDDIMLVNNTRQIKGTPETIKLQKEGLDYSLAMPGRAEPLTIRQSSDGLWRMGADQPVVQLTPTGKAAAGDSEELTLMGDRRIGRLELLEANAVRVRFANSWFFPSRSGEWSSMGVRQVRWEHTFYADGRHVTYAELNNSGGSEIGQVRIVLPRAGYWAGGGLSKELTCNDFAGPAGKWALEFPTPPAVKEPSARLAVGKVKVTLGAQGSVCESDQDKDGYDERQGCYYLGGKGRHCRFEFSPPQGAAVVNPSFRVAGPWKGAVHVQSQGQAVRQVALVEDGACIFTLAGSVSRPVTVEVTQDGD